MVPSNIRALDILVVGLGRAGGSLAGELHRRGYRAVAFNSSEGDLEALAPETSAISLPDGKRIHIGLEGQDGTGGDPEVGRECVRKSAQAIRDVMKRELGEAAAILVVAGLGGGTGSAVSTFVEVMGRDISPVVVMATMPTQGENAIAKVRAARAVAELTRAELDGLILVDNARIADLNPDVPIADYHARINEMIMEPFDALNTLGSRSDLHAVCAFDGSALAEVLLSGGVLTYGVSQLDSLSSESVSNAISDALYSSWLLASGLEPSSVSTMAVVLEATDQDLATAPNRVVEQLREQWKADTNGGVVQLGIYKTTEPREHSVLRMIASCCAIPTRAKQLVSEAVSEARAMKEKVRKLPALDVAELDDVDLSEDKRARRPKSNDPQPKKARPGNAPNAPKKMLPKLRAKEERREASAPTPGPDRDDLPGRAAYARIVARFRSTTSDEVRRVIARRLEEDRLSDHPAVRYHAVDAMAKLGRDMFESALLAATEDEDAAVRALACRALQN